MTPFTFYAHEDEGREEEERNWNKSKKERSKKGEEDTCMGL